MSAPIPDAANASRAGAASGSPPRVGIRDTIPPPEDGSRTPTFDAEGRGFLSRWDKGPRAAPHDPALCPASGGESGAVADIATVHATGVVVGEAGVLIRGESGAGKSTLALALIDRVSAAGGFCALVGDDRVRLAVADGQVAARPHPAIAGLIATRATGIVAIASVEACLLRLVVDLDTPGARQAEAASAAILLGIALPRLRIVRAARDAGLGPSLVLEALGVSSQPHTPVPVPRPGPPP